MSENTIHHETPTIFLAMFWAGGGPYTIAQIIHVYDWINRAIPSRIDLEVALNTLLSLNLITMQDDKFLIPRNIGNDFDVFRKKKRKSKFKCVDMYFRQYNPLPDIPQLIEISKETYSSELTKYYKIFEES
jgi:hypothetical protein